VGEALSLLFGEQLTGVRGLSLLSDDVVVGMDSSLIVEMIFAGIEK
jgi:hypothetical protein